MSDYFQFGDIDSRAYNCYVFPMNIDDAPSVSQQKVAIPGRHGSMLYTSRTFSNVRHRYLIVVYETASRTADSQLILLRNALVKYTGYARLADTFHPDEYYMARYAGGLDVEFLRGRDMVKVIVEFDRMPQRFLTSGEETITVSSSTNITNPTNFPSNPLLRIYGKGSCTINGTSVTISSSSGYSYIDVDCEMKDCYNGNANCNSLVSFTSYEFPELQAGSNYISKGDVSSIVITPRWWRV